MPTTTTQTVSCPCCGGTPAVCAICSPTGTGSDSGTLPNTMHVTFGNNMWVLSELFCTVIGGTPYLDCVGSPPGIDPGPDVCGFTGLNPPPYQIGASPQVVASSRLSPVSFEVVWDSSYEVRIPVVGSPYSAGILVQTGAWVYHGYNCHGWTEFRVLAYCDNVSGTGKIVVELIWLAPDNYTGTGTGTATGEEVRGAIKASTQVGPSGFGPNNSCSPVYFQIGNTVAFSDNRLLWTGTTPNQTPSGNVIDSTFTQADAYLYAIVTA